MAATAGILTDIEGTTTPIAFVHRTLFPFARTRMAAFIATHRTEPEVAAALAETEKLAPGRAPLDTLLGWMDQDAKVMPLKALQGLIWRDGYAAGELQSELYPDVAPALRRWHAGGLRLAVYSSGSVGAQRLLFGHAPEGDLTPLFAGFFDTATGAKREAASYGAIARALDLGPGTLLFLSDVEAELDAAMAAGLATCQLVRPADGTVASSRHQTAADFAAVSNRFGLR
ncbi:MAG: acireductone synthase [Acetobacteraceae bacterium]|nr:acireductone synthase [Acetobacteraceae bacterium]